MSIESARRRPAKKSGLSVNLILAIVLVAVCGLAYWLEIRKKHLAGGAGEGKSHLFSFAENEELAGLRLVAKDKSLDAELRCKARCNLNDPTTEWELTSPLAFKADGANVGTFITGAMAANVVESLPIEGDAEQMFSKFGLGKDKRDEHRVVIKLKKDSEPYVIYFGDNAAVGENVYALVSGPGLKLDSVKIVPGYLKINSQRALSYWRAKKLFDFAASEVEGFTLKNPAGTLELKREGGNWFLMPGNRLADNEAVDTYVTGLAFLNGQDYLSDDKAKDAGSLGIGPGTHHYTLSIKVAKRPDVKLEVYDFVKDREPHLYAVFADKPYIVSLDRTAAERFNKKTDSFRFRNLLTAAEKEQVGQFTVKLGGKGTLTFKREDSGWKLAEGQLEKLDPAAAEQALVKLGAARIADFEGRKAPPSDVPELSSWRLVDKSGKVLRELKVYGSEAKAEYYVRLASGELGKLERGSGSAVPSKLESFQKAK